MGRIILIGVAIVAALVFLPGLLQGGSGGAKDAGSRAGSNIADAAKDPQAVVDSAGNAIEPVKEAAAPWWEWLVAQPWFYAALGAGIAAFLLRNMWRNMGPVAQKTAIGVGVALVFLVAIATGSLK